MDYPEPGSPQGAWDAPGEASGYGGGCYEQPARGEEEAEAATSRAVQHPLARPPRRPQQRPAPPLRAALSTSSSEGEPEAAAAPPREPSLSDEAGVDFDEAESDASLRYSTGTGGEVEGAGLASSESGGSGFSLAAAALPERRRPGGGRPRYEVVRELGAEEVRWFYREDRKTWKPFIGYDSLRIELAYRALGAGGPAEPREGEAAAVEPVCVRSGLYEVDVVNAESYPVYWNGECRRPSRRERGAPLPSREEQGVPGSSPRNRGGRLGCLLLSPARDAGHPLCTQTPDGDTGWPFLSLPAPSAPP